MGGSVAGKGRFPATNCPTTKVDLWSLVRKMCIRDSPGCGVDTHSEAMSGKIASPIWEAVSYTHLDVYKRQ